MRPSGVAVVLALAVGADAFVGPTVAPSRGSMYMSSKDAGAAAFKIQTAGVSPAALDLKGMTVKLGVDALSEFQGRRSSILGQNPEKETVELTMNRFNNLYKRPVIPFYRTTLYELVQTTHLAVTDATFMYTHFFAYGFVYAFDAIFKGYPVENEYIAFFEAAARSANLDPDKIRKDADLLKAYMTSGKTEADFDRAIESPKDGDVVEQELAAIKAGSAFLPERYFSFGLCKTMEALGAEVNWESIKRFCNKLGLEETRTQLDWDLLERTTRKLSDVETLMKQVEIREKKRLAERLEAKAKKAAEAAAASLAAAAPEKAEPKADKQPAPSMA